MLLISPVKAENLRVISLYPGHSDNIYALGGENILIALSENDDIDLLPNLPRISMRSGAEKILSLSPDIVVTRNFAQKINPNLYNILERAGVKIITLDPPDWANFQEYLRILASELNLNPDSAINKLNNIRDEISRQAQNIRTKPRVFIEATSKEIHTCAPDSWAANLIKLAGGVNIAESARPLRSGSSIAPYGLERVIKSLENLDIYIIQTGAMNNTNLKDFYSRHWAGALKNVKVREIPEKYLSRPSLLGLEKGGRMLIEIFAEFQKGEQIN